MMKLPRDISGIELANVLESVGYSITRTSGSHIRLTTQRNGIHHITIPAHKVIKIGTLSAILTAIANHLELSKEKLIAILFR